MKKEKLKNIPMGANQWKKHGLKYGYWNFFETEIRRDWIEELKEKNEGARIQAEMDAKTFSEYKEKLLRKI